MTRDDFLAAARGMVDTPFRHQGRLPGIGLDCGGLAICALIQCGYPVNDPRGYGRLPAKGMLEQALLDHCDRIALADLLPGDLMAFAFRTESQHIAIVTSLAPVMLLHAYADVGKVVENGCDATWQNRLRGCWRLRGIE